MERGFEAVQPTRGRSRQEVTHTHFPQNRIKEMYIFQIYFPGARSSSPPSATWGSTTLTASTLTGSTPPSGTGGGRRTGTTTPSWSTWVLFHHRWAWGGGKGGTPPPEVHFLFSNVRTFLRPYVLYSPPWSSKFDFCSPTYVFHTHIF